jgi:hypothetical protein
MLASLKILKHSEPIAGYHLFFDEFLSIPEIGAKQV